MKILNYENAEDRRILDSIVLDHIGPLKSGNTDVDSNKIMVYPREFAAIVKSVKFEPNISDTQYNYAKNRQEVKMNPQFLFELSIPEFDITLTIDFYSTVIEKNRTKVVTHIIETRLRERNVGQTFYLLVYLHNDPESFRVSFKPLKFQFYAY